MADAGAAAGQKRPAGEAPPGAPKAKVAKAKPGAAAGAAAAAPDAKAPVAKTPAAKAPVAKSPATKAPAAKTPAAKAPVAKAPVAKALAAAAGAPAAKAPVAKAPVAKAPVAKAPVAKAPAAKAPEVEAPEPPEPVAKAPVAKAPVAKAPVAKAPVAKAPVAKAPVAKAPVAKAPVAKAPVAKAPVAKAPVAKAPVAKAPVAKAPEAKAPVAKAPVAKAPAASPSPTESPTDDAAEGVKRAQSDSWRDFEDSDPLYALLGEVAADKVFVNGELRPEPLDRYLHKLLIRKAARKPKDWVEVWAAMDIPVEHQTPVLTPMLIFALDKAPVGFGEILAALLIGHRTKTKAIQEAVAVAFRDKDDRYNILNDFFYAILPRCATSPWGWSRIGWGFKEWWRLLEACVTVLSPVGAFDALASLLDRIEAAGGTELAQQPQLWKEERLAVARSLLCRFGGLDKESDLVACMDAVLA